METQLDPSAAPLHAAPEPRNGYLRITLVLLLGPIVTLRAYLFASMVWDAFDDGQLGPGWEPQTLWDPMWLPIELFVSVLVAPFGYGLLRGARLVPTVALVVGCVLVYMALSFQGQPGDVMAVPFVAPIIAVFGMVFGRVHFPLVRGEFEA